MPTRTSLVIGIAAVAIAASGIGVGVAYADPPTPSGSPTSAPASTPAGATPSAQPSGSTAKPGHEKRRSLEKRALHGEATLAGAQHTVVVFQRGTITAADSAKITVTSADGYAATYQVSGDTTIRQAKKDVAVSQATTGTKVSVVATQDGSTVTAKRIVLAAH